MRWNSDTCFGEQSRLSLFQRKVSMFQRKIVDVQTWSLSMFQCLGLSLFLRRWCRCSSVTVPVQKEINLWLFQSDYLSMFQCECLSMFQREYLSMVQSEYLSMFQRHYNKFFTCHLWELNPGPSCQTKPLHREVTRSLWEGTLKHLSMFQRVDVPTCRCSRVSMFQCVDVPACRCSSVSMFQCVDVSALKVWLFQRHCSSALLSMLENSSFEFCICFYTVKDSYFNTRKRMCVVLCKYWHHATISSTK